MKFGKSNQDWWDSYAIGCIRLAKVGDINEYSCAKKTSTTTKKKSPTEYLDVFTQQEGCQGNWRDICKQWAVWGEVKEWVEGRSLRAAQISNAGWTG